MPVTVERTTPSPQRSRGRRPLVIALLVIALLVGGAIGVSVWAVRRSNRTVATPRAASFARYKGAWSSALRKAGVRAVFPNAPVDVTALKVTGRRPFDATFTAEEVTALMNVYRYTDGTQQFVFDGASVAFPSPGVARIDATIIVDGTRYGARAVMPLSYDPKGIHSAGITSLSVEGFNVGGERKRQASDAVLAFLNDYLRSAPGLTVTEARIEQGRVRVIGSAPVRIENP